MTWINRQRGRLAHCIFNQNKRYFIHSCGNNISLYFNAEFQLSLSQQKIVLFPVIKNSSSQILCYKNTIQHRKVILGCGYSETDHTRLRIPESLYAFKKTIILFKIIKLTTS
ncbi:hypothetical protein FYL58_10895 [Klebsiella aerogenes]|nr:hypothetical protein [Klebsiella aerogenes]EIW9498071.1 hypothetical protein [Klebsiella aerogenes]